MRRSQVSRGWLKLSQEQVRWTVNGQRSKRRSAAFFRVKSVQAAALLWRAEMKRKT
jgi:hypothetical protein